MVFEKGDFIKLLDGNILEVVYADEVKAVCLKLIRDDGSIGNGGWFYAGNSAVISNNMRDYKGKTEEWEKVPRIQIVGCPHWKPLRVNYDYPMI